MHPENYRSRLVVCEMRCRGEDGRALFATFMFSADKPLRMQFWDVSLGPFCGTAQREIYVDLPEEDQNGEHCGLLVKSMYGTQDASLWGPLHA